MRHGALRKRPNPVPPPVLRVCPALCGVRGGGGLPLSLGPGLPLPAGVAALYRSPHLPVYPGPGPGLCLEEWSPQMGLMNGLDRGLVQKIPGAPVVVTSLDWAINNSRGNSIWTVTFGLACCA